MELIIGILTLIIVIQGIRIYDLSRLVKDYESGKIYKRKIRLLLKHMLDNLNKELGEI
jgi:hypothetical protein